MSELRPRPIWPLLALVIASGAASLAIEMAMARLLGRTLGSTSGAVALVLAGVLGGMGAGALAAERWIHLAPRPVAGYAVCELAACLAAVLFFAASPAYTAVMRLPGGEAVLGVATALVTVPWGATLPFLVRAVGGSPRRVRAVYGWNAAGGALGAVLGGCVAIPLWGEWGVVAAGAGAQAAVAFLAVAWDRACSRDAGPPAVSVPQAAPLPQLSSRPAALLFSTGFLVLYWEVLWTRILTLTVGSTAYSLAVITAAVILGTGLGSLLAPIARCGRGLPLLAALFSAALHPLVPRFADVYLLGVRAAAESTWLDWGPLAWGTAAAGSVAFVPNFLLGSLFPWAVAQAPARAGRLYAWSSLGCIGGALAAGPWGAQALGLEPAYALGVLGLTALSLAVLWPAGRCGRCAAAAAALAVAAALGPVAAGTWSRWDPLRLLSGVFQWSRADLESLPLADSLASRQLVVLERGREVTVTVELDDAANTVYVRGNGKVEGGVPAEPGKPSLADLPTQILLGALPAQLSRPGPDRSALLVGFGSGVTLGALAGGSRGFPVEAIDVIEIEAGFVRAVTHERSRRHFAPFLPPQVLDASAGPGPRFHFGDARRLLAVELAGRQWDAIVSQPSEPWLPGAAPLFTREFFEDAAARLRPGGLFVQWLQLYKLGWDDVVLALRTFHRAFPSVFVARPPGTGEVILIGSAAPPALDRLLAAPPGAGELLTGIESQLDRLAIFVLGPRAVGDVVGHDRGLPVNTDARGELEYRVARSLYAAVDSSRQVLRRLQAAGGRDPISAHLLAPRRDDRRFLAELAARNARLGDFAEALALLQGDMSEAAAALRREIAAASSEAP